MKIALGQINSTVGDFSGNCEKILRFTERAKQGGADLALFPELSISGYPPRDFLDKPAFIARNQEVLYELAEKVRGIAVIVGVVTPASKESGKLVMNSAALLKDGEVAFVQSKMLLPTYDVFDELRHFEPAGQQQVYKFACNRIALTICEDAWNDKNFWNRQLYSVDPVERLVSSGSDIILNISASPFHVGKRELRRKILQAIARRYQLPVVLVNQVGGNDSLIFDGSSIALRADGSVAAQAKSFAEDLIFFNTASLAGDMHEQIEGDDATAYSALVLGTCDYVRKCGFKQVVLGLSGGIDSAITACIAVDALGRENVAGLGMPGPYSSEGSINDARALAANLGIRFELLPMRGVYEEYLQALHPVFAGRPMDVAEENLQSRIRGAMLMAFSNKFGGMVLTTGNKSELAVGYCTLYGDMCGGLAVLGDVPKTLVYRLAEYRNRISPVIPRATMEKPPSAELRPGQQDSDTLPPYDVLDRILNDYVEDYKTAEQIADEHGYSEQLVRTVIRLIEKSEYKRQQAAPVLKITEKAFGAGRRFPIASKAEV